MSTFKITNLTNTFGRRDNKYNTDIEIGYIDGMTKKVLNVKPGESVYLTISNLPLSVHRLRVKKFISVIEITQSELSIIIEDSVPKIPKKNIEPLNLKKEKIIEKIVESKISIKKKKD